MRVGRSWIARNTRGDTIVEVLIAIGVVSVILGGAYVTSNRSLQGTREAQERANALKITEAQVEQVKGIASGPSASTLFDLASGSTFCVDENGAIEPSVSDASCKVNVSGVPATAQPAFDVRVLRTGNLFTFTTQWDKLRGGGRNTVQIKYRIYE